MDLQQPNAGLLGQAFQPTQSPGGRYQIVNGEVVFVGG
jgi:hypothetical protein